MKLAIMILITITVILKRKMKSMRQKREAIFHIKDLIKVELSQEGNSEACGQSVSRVLDT